MSEDKRQSIKENLRLFQLDALLQKCEYFTAEELEEKLHVSPATFNRDIKSLRERYNAPLRSLYFPSLVCSIIGTCS